MHSNLVLLCPTQMSSGFPALNCAGTVKCEVFLSTFIRIGGVNYDEKNCINKKGRITNRGTQFILKTILILK